MSNKVNENISKYDKNNASWFLSSYSQDFLSSNTLIGKATFLLFVIILFIFIFSILSKAVIFF